MCQPLPKRGLHLTGSSGEHRDFGSSSLRVVKFLCFLYLTSRVVLDEAVPETEKGTSRAPVDSCIRDPAEPRVLNLGPAERACSARPWSFRCPMFRFTSYHAYVHEETL